MVKIYEAAQAKKNQIILRTLIAVWYKDAKAARQAGTEATIGKDGELVKGSKTGGKDTCAHRAHQKDYRS